MSVFLKLPEFVENHHVSQGQVGPSGINAELNFKFSSINDALFQFLFTDYNFGVAKQSFHD